MKLKDINSSNIRKISDGELRNLHYRTHQQHSIAKRFKRRDERKRLKNLHDDLALEMYRRNMNHNSPLIENLYSTRTNLKGSNDMKYVSEKWISDNSAASLPSYESPAKAAPLLMSSPLFRKTPLLRKNKLKKKEKILGETGVKIKVKPGALGLELDDPLSMYKGQLTGGKAWDKLSKQLTTLYIFNKNKHPDVANQAMSKRDALARWVETKRATNPDFAK